MTTARISDAAGHSNPATKMPLLFDLNGRGGRFELPTPAPKIRARWGLHGMQSAALSSICADPVANKKTACSQNCGCHELGEIYNVQQVPFNYVTDRCVSPCGGRRACHGFTAAHFDSFADFDV
jgi:hypothetical protein